MATDNLHLVVLFSKDVLTGVIIEKVQQGMKEVYENLKGWNERTSKSECKRRHVNLSPHK